MEKWKEEGGDIKGNGGREGEKKEEWKKGGRRGWREKSPQKQPLKCLKDLKINYTKIYLK